MFSKLFTALLIGSGLAIDPSDNAFNSLEKVSLSYFDLSPPYVDDQLQNHNWNFGEDSLVEVSKQIRLTSDVQSQSGWLWDAKSFVIEFDFSINYKGTLSGDGFAFWLTKEPQKQGPVFGNEDFFTGLGIFFDTYANSRVRHTYPYIMAMLGDGKTHYDHDFDGNASELGGCAAEFRNKAGSTTVRITNVHEKYLKLEYKNPDSQAFITCFTISTTLPDKKFIGFSAMTGGVSSEHAIQKVRVWNIVRTEDVKSEYVQNNKPTSQSYSKPAQSSGWGFFTWFFIILVLAIVGYAGWVYYNTTKQHSYKRF